MPATVCRSHLDSQRDPQSPPRRFGRLPAGQCWLFGMTLSLLATLAQSAAPGVDFRTLMELDTETLEARLEDAAGRERRRIQLLLAQRYMTAPERIEPLLNLATARLPTAPASGDEPDLWLQERAFSESQRCALSWWYNDTRGDRGACQTLPALRDRLSEPVIVTTLLKAEAFAAMQAGDLPSARRLSREALRAARAAGSKRQLASSLMLRGVVLVHDGLPRSALRYFVRARDQYPNGDRYFPATLRALIASAQLAAGLPEDALPVLRESLADAASRLAVPITVRLRDQIAEAELKLGRPEEAHRTLAGVFAGPVPSLPRSTVISALSTLALVEEALGQADLATERFLEALSTARATGDQARAQLVERRYAAVLLSRNKPADALVLIEPQIRLLRNDAPNMHLSAALETAAGAYAALGDYEAAYAAETEAQAVVRSAVSNRFGEEMVEQQAELASAQALSELAAVRSQADLVQAAARFNTVVLITLLLLGIIGALLTYLWMSRRLQQRAALVQQEAAEELEALVIARTQELESELANRLLLQEERRQLEANLAEGEKLRSIGQLTSGVAHDFNNLMTVVSLSAEMLKQTSGTLTKRQQQSVEDILLAAESGAHITSGLLAYARQQPQAAVTVDLHRYLGQARPLFVRTLGEGIELQYALTSATAAEEFPLPPRVVVDPSNLTTAIINLLLNAREALQDRGTVCLSTAVTGDRIAIALRDSGPGMSEEVRERAIEPFYTTKDSGKGSGLGLSMVFGFTKQSGGDFRLDPAPGGGACATIELPLSAEGFELEAHEALNAEIVVRCNQTVLLVEDQPALRVTMTRLLETMGMTVVSLESADRAIEWVNDNGAPDLLLSDIVMPGCCNGIELAEQLRGRFPALPILLTSGYTDLVDIDYPLLRKPFGFQELERKVAEVVKASTGAQPGPAAVA